MGSLAEIGVDVAGADGAGANVESFEQRGVGRDVAIAELARRRNGRNLTAPHRFWCKMPFLSPTVLPIILLVLSNVFMTTAWYGHLKFPHMAMWVAVMVSWGIALVEYWLAVPANRIGYGTYSAAELKTIQEVISLTVFVAFAIFVLGEKLTWNHGIGFMLIALGAFFIFKGPLR